MAWFIYAAALLIYWTQALARQPWSLNHQIRFWCAIQTNTIPQTTLSISTMSLYFPLICASPNSTITSIDLALITARMTSVRFVVVFTPDLLYSRTHDHNGVDIAWKFRAHGQLRYNTLGIHIQRTTNGMGFDVNISDSQLIRSALVQWDAEVFRKLVYLRLDLLPVQTVLLDHAFEIVDEQSGFAWSSKWIRLMKQVSRLVDCRLHIVTGKHLSHSVVE